LLESFLMKGIFRIAPWRPGLCESSDYVLTRRTAG
jgi:hypothetical protein